MWVAYFGGIAAAFILGWRLGCESWARECRDWVDLAQYWRNSSEDWRAKYDQAQAIVVRQDALIDRLLTESVEERQ